MSKFEELNLNKQLRNAISDLGFENQTPIQEQTYSKILSGKDIVGIAQTGTGKTIAYCLPLLQELSYSNQNNPRILILVPTRELVAQVVETLKELTEYISCRIVGRSPCNWDARSPADISCRRAASLRSKGLLHRQSLSRAQITSA